MQDTIPPSTPATPTPSKNDIPPMVSFSITNPVKYLKEWWKNVMGKEGVDVNFKIHPITAVVVALILVAGGASAGWIIKAIQFNAQKVPGLNAIVPTLTPEPTPTPTPDPWKDTAYTGQLQKTDARFYLVTSEAEAVTLEIPDNVNLTKYIGKRILAVGKYNKDTGVLVVSDATDLEVLIQSTAVPTLSPSPTPVPTTSPVLPPDTLY